MSSKIEMFKYTDPGFGTNSGSEDGDSRTYETSTPSGAYNNRMIPVNEDGSVRIDGQHVFGRFGARPALYQETIITKRYATWMLAKNLPNQWILACPQ